MYRVFDLFDRHGEVRDWSAELKELYDSLEEAGERAREARVASRIAGTTTSLPEPEFAGTYADRLFGTVEVTAGPDGLVARYGPGLGGRLEHWHHDTFLLRYETRWRGESLITFRVGASGRVEELVMNGAEFRKEGGR
jgi:hypothetical protein